MSQDQLECFDCGERFSWDTQSLLSKTSIPRKDLYQHDGLWPGTNYNNTAPESDCIENISNNHRKGVLFTNFALFAGFQYTVSHFSSAPLIKCKMPV